MSVPSIKVTNTDDSKSDTLESFSDTDELIEDSLTNDDTRTEELEDADCKSYWLGPSSFLSNIGVSVSTTIGVICKYIFIVVPHVCSYVLNSLTIVENRAFGKSNELSFLI